MVEKGERLGSWEGWKLGGRELKSCKVVKLGCREVGRFGFLV
jgi:hypothetical protein